MLRNRSKISQNNHRNARKRNRRNDDQSSSSEFSCSSNDSESSSQDYSSEEIPYDESSDSSFEDDSVSPVIGRKLRTRRKRLNSKSKRSNKVIHNKNRNSRSKKKSHRTSDSHTAGPSRINSNCRRARSENSNTRTAKRKYKDRSDDSETTFSEICNTSSEDFESSSFHIKKKRLRQAILNTSESDDSVIQPAIMRRPHLLDSESSTSASEEVMPTRRVRNGNRALPSWSDSSAESIELNSQGTSTTESTSSSSIQNTRRIHSEYIATSDSGSSSSSSFNNSSFSVDSEVANITSVLDSEASSSYNTAQSTSSNNIDDIKDKTSDSDSSDSDGEKCAICLKKFRNQLIGNPSNCDHNFCAPCLKKWSESSTTCPVDRSTFDSITIRTEINGPVVDRLKVENRNFGVFPPLDIDEVLLNDAINCEICGSGDDEETLLLCDFCNLGYHMACLRPPLSAIPAGAWYCPPCMDLHSAPAQNVNEAFRVLTDFPTGSLFLLSSARRPNRIRTSNNRSRPNGPLPRGRGPTRGFRSQNLSNSRFQNLSNVIESVMANRNVESSSRSRRRKKRRNRHATSTNALQQLTTAENLEMTSDAISRITKKGNQRMSNSGNNSNMMPRPRGPRDVVDMVFPSFSLFGGDELDYFSDGPDEHDVDGEVAIMARVRNEYTARRLGNRKNIVTSLNNYHDRSAAVAPMGEITDNATSANLLDTILESQTLWHSKNVEIKSKKDGTLEIKKKEEQNKKPDLTNTNHSSKEIPLFPNKGDGASDNKSYTNSNNRYSTLGNSSGGSGNSFSSSSSSFNNLNPSTRPGFSNLLGNNPAALDLSPFRGAAPIRFRMNAPRPMMRRQNYNSNSQRHPSNSPAGLHNSVQSPKKSSTVGNAEEEVDLYDDIETENADTEKSQEIFASLEPPPEPPALLIGSDSSSDDENNGLVIDDKVVNKSNIYDPNEPNEDSDTENNEDKNSNMVPGYLRSPSYGGLSEFGPHLPLPEPPALPIELDSVKDSDEEEEAECPNMTLYSSTSINLANNVQDIPIPDAAYPQDELECIPVPTPTLDANPTNEEISTTQPDSKLYSPTDKNDSETSSLAEVEIPSPKKSPPQRRDNSEIRSISSRDSSRDLSDPSSGDESGRSERSEKPVRKRTSRRRSDDNETGRRSSVNEASVIDLIQNEKPSKEIDLTEVDSNDEKDQNQSDEESVDDSKPESEEIADKYDVTAISADKQDQEEAEKSDNEKDTDEKSPTDAASSKSVNEDDKTDSEDEEKRKTMAVEADVENAVEDASVDTSLEAESGDKIAEDSVNAISNDVNASGNYLLPSEDLDPVSDVEYNDFSECQRSSSIRDKRKKRKKTRRRDSSPDNKTVAEAKELEEGEIEEEKSKRKYSSSQKKKGRSETPERSPDRRLKKKRDRKEKTTGKENKDNVPGGKSAGGSAGGASGEDLQWKKLSKNTKERNYRDGKAKPNEKTDKAKDREIKSRKEKRKEIERYDVRKIVSDKPPRPVRDEFGRDVSANRSRSRTRSRSQSYMGRRRSKGTMRRSFSQEDRWIDWSPVRNQQRRSRSRTRRTRSRSRNRSRLSGDRYRNRSKNRDREREYDKREPRKRKRSISSEIEKYTPPPAELKKRRRSRDRSHKSESYVATATIRPSGRERDIPAEYYYERSRSWSRSLSYASLTPEPEQYVRYSRSPSIIEAPTRIPLVSPTRDHNLMPQNPQNLTVIVPNVDLSKKKHKKKKESKKKKKKQPSKEVFTSGDNIVVSVNFDDNQKIISAKSSKRKHDEEKGRKKKKDETRKKRKQTLQVSDEVLNAKPVAVIDLNSSPCKEMSPTEVISLTDSGDDEANVIIENVIPTDRRIASSQEDAGTTPAERRAYVMTQSGPKTPPEPPIKFVVNSTAPSRPLPTNPIFEQDEIDAEDALHYNKGPNTPPEPGNQQRRSISPSTTMYDPFEPTKSRSQSPENAQYDKDAPTGTTVEERRPVIDMFSEDNDKPTESQSSGASAEKSKPQEDAVKENATATPTKSSTAVEDPAPSTNTKSPAKDASAAESANETAQANGVNTLVLDLSSLGDDFVPKSSIPLVKTSQGKYEFQSGKAPDKPITVVISQQSQPAKPQPQQVMVTPTRQVPTKPVEPMKQPVFPDILSWKLPPPMSQTNFSTPPPTSSSLPSGGLVTPSKSAPGLLAQNGNQEESSFEVDDSPYSPASSEGDDLFEPPPLNASTSSPNKQRPSPMPAVNSFKSRVDALFSSSPIKKVPPRGNVPPHVSKPVSAIKGTKKVLKPPPPIPSKKDPGIRADEEQLKILDDVPNSAVEMMVKEKFLKKLHRQERVVEEVKVVLKPHYAKKHITKQEYKDILRKAVPKICHNKSGDINPSKIQSLVEAYVKKIRHAKKKPTMGAGAPLFPPMKTGKATKPQKTLWG